MPSDNNVITLKLEQVAIRQENTDKKISMLTDRVLNPESGLFAKLKSNEVQTGRNREDLEDLHENIDKLLSVCQTHENSVSAIERWMENHEQRDDELRNNIEQLTKSVKDYTNWTEKKFEKNEESLRPLRDDLTIRKSNKLWKDKILWIIITGLVMALAVQPIVKLFSGSYQEKQTIKNNQK